jgi:hypothetical protein
MPPNNSPEPDHVFGSAFAVDSFGGAAQLLSHQNSTIMIIDKHGVGKFLVYMLAALIVFIVVLAFIVRTRPQRPVFRILVLAVIAVVGGMTFARVTYGSGVPWWIFYGLPALVTFVLPPLALSRRELLVYVPLSVLMAPMIHICFSFFFGWHDYMPLFYVPYWRECF